jgi:predicted ABC-type transport system involved in lysophospholipase L1 biosynthesis ATPase subunit
MSVLAVDAVRVSYGDFHALAGVSLQIDREESVALIGRSGSGKTTLLHVLAGFVHPTEGTLSRDGTTAVVFQGARLIPQLTAIENVSFAANPAVDGESLLGLVGLEAKLDALPGELSGGEAQRVAIARALAQRPDVLLCDEPTGHLDSDTSTRVLDLIDALRAELGYGLVMATHDPDVAARCGRIVEINDGRIAAEVAR